MIIAKIRTKDGWNFVVNADYASRRFPDNYVRVETPTQTYEFKNVLEAYLVSTDTGSTVETICPKQD